MVPRGEAIYSEAGGIKEQISVLVTMRADKVMMTAAIIYPFKRAVPEYIVDCIPADFTVARSDSGWMTSSIFFELMTNCFLPELNQIRRKNKGLQNDEDLILDDNDWVVYWLDGHTSHLTLHTSKV